MCCRSNIISVYLQCFVGLLFAAKKYCPKSAGYFWSEQMPVISTMKITQKIQLQRQYLASREYIHAMPMSITQLVLPHNSVPITTVNSQLCLTTTEVHTQQRVTVLHLQHNEVFCIAFRELGDRSLVEYQSVVPGRHQLQTCVAFCTFGQRLKPSPAISTEAVLRLLTSRSIKPLSTSTSSTHKHNSYSC